jgi:hypothetical protein
MSKVPKATHEGDLNIGGTTIHAAVLEDGTRVLSERGMMAALGGKRGGSHWQRKNRGAEGGDLPVYVSASNLAPFITEDLRTKLEAPLVYRTLEGGNPANGVRADALPAICDVWLKARDTPGALHHTQAHIAVQADILMRGLAHVGITALVDEATGYQEDRDRQDLQRILEAYISKELLPWTKQFPDEFYREMFRLRGWRWSPVSVKRPGYVGKLTNKLVYEKLPRGVLEELRERNPRDPGKKRRRHLHHQFLTDDVGHPHLGRHLAAVVALMRAAPDWRTFERMFARAFPAGEQLELEMGDDKDEGLNDNKAA